MFNSFRWRLTFFFGALSLVTLLIASCYIGRIAMNELAASSGEMLYANAKSAANLLCLGLNEKEKDIHLLSIVPNLKESDLSDGRIRTLLEIRKETYNAFAWLGIVDLRAIVLQATGGMLVGHDVSQWRWFRSAVQKSSVDHPHTTMLSPPILPAKAENEPARLVDFAAPIFDENNRVRGVLSSHLLWDWVTDTVSSGIPDDAKQRGIEILIADKPGSILYPYLSGDGFKPPLDWKHDERYRIMDWGERQYLVSQAPVKIKLDDQSELRIIVRQPADLAYAPAYEFLFRLLALGTVAAILFTIAAYYASSRMSHPIEQLARAIHHVGKGETKSGFFYGNNIVEIKQLSDSIQAANLSLLDKENELEALNASLEKQVKERTSDLLQLNQELEKLATTDGLTKVNNRRSFDEKLLENFQLAKRHKMEFALLLIDIDFFKKVNDVYGHQAGDCVLRHLGQTLKDNSRATDFIARYGGEEFVILLPNIEDRQEGYFVAEKIRRAVYSAPVSPVGLISVSIGVSYSHKDDETEQDVVERADKALYMAKESGRNRVVSLSRQPDLRKTHIASS